MGSRTIQCVLVSCCLLVAGCQNFNIQPGDLAPVLVSGSVEGSATIAVVPGKAFHGKAPWTSFVTSGTAVVVGGYANPKWAFQDTDQIQLGKHLARELERSGIFSHVSFGGSVKSDFAIVLKFDRTIQYEDKTKYDFYLTMTIRTSERALCKKSYELLGEYGLAEYFTGTTFRAGKANAANRLLKELEADIQKWLDGSRCEEA